MFLIIIMFPGSLRMINYHLEGIISINYHVQELNLSMITMMVIWGYNLG